MRPDGGPYTMTNETHDLDRTLQEKPGSHNEAWRLGPRPGIIVLVLLGVLSSGCKTDSLPGDDCVCDLGDTQPCTCSDGLSGLQHCAASCDGWETCSCPDPPCGNGACSPDENCEACPADCDCSDGTVCMYGRCSECGNGICGSGEDCWVCPEDCTCGGNLVCEQDGTCTDCGNAVCDAGENCESCVADCNCPWDQTCYAGSCCTPDCDGRDCGPDGCGGECGQCYYPADNCVAPTGQCCDYDFTSTCTQDQCIGPQTLEVCQSGYLNPECKRTYTQTCGAGCHVADGRCCAGTNESYGQTPACIIAAGGLARGDIRAPCGTQPDGCIWGCMLGYACINGQCTNTSTLYNSCCDDSDCSPTGGFPRLCNFCTSNCMIPCISGACPNGYHCVTNFTLCPGVPICWVD